MFRSMCAVALLPSLALAQSSVAPPPNLTSQEPQAQSEPSLRHFTYYSKIRRGTREKAALQVVLITNPSVTLPAILPASFEVDASDGLTVTNVECPKTYGHLVELVGEEYKARNGGTVRFQIQADRHSNLGTHVLKGRLMFHVIRADGTSAPQQIEVQIPLVVADRNDKVTKTWPFHRDLSRRELIILSPVLVLMIMPLALACTLGFREACF